MDYRKNNNMCLAKTVFWSLSLANIKATKIFEKGGPIMRAYHCPNCLQYHLSSKIVKQVFEPIARFTEKNNMKPELLKKWEETGLLQELEQDKKQNMAEMLEKATMIMLRNPKDIKDRKFLDGLLPAVRVAAIRGYCNDIPWLYEDFKSWLKSNSPKVLTRDTIKDFVDSSESRYLSK